MDLDRACLSSMPLDELVCALDPPAPQHVLDAAGGLRYRCIVTINLMLNQAEIVPDNWIYIHDPNVRAGRAQFYKNWSSKMVPDTGKSMIGLEYFCWEGDLIWSASDEKLTDLAVSDLQKLRIADPRGVFDSMAVRYRNAYPVYDCGYAERLRTIRQYLGGIKNLYPIGRYGQFRYNNMDHSILTAHYSVKAIQGQQIDPWSVNTEAQYHEQS